MGATRLKLVGERFGRLLVTESAVNPDRKKSYWVCKCDCGTVKTVRASELRSGVTVSCGCYKLERIRKHGLYGTPIYRKWASMRARCMYPSQVGYCNYGGRGIKVCDRWMTFSNFFEDMGDIPKDTPQLDRLDNEGDYDPGNVEWASAKQNANNKRDSVKLEYQGRTQTVAEWADEIGIKRATLYYRISSGWPVEKAFMQKVNVGKGWRKQR